MVTFICNIKKAFLNNVVYLLLKNKLYKYQITKKHFVNKSIIEYIKQILVTEMLCELSQSKSVYKSINTNKSNTSLNIGYN